MMRFSAILLAMIMALIGIFSASAENASDSYPADFANADTGVESASVSPVRDVTLYYPTADSTEFTRTTRTLPADSSEVLIRSALSELVVGNAYIDISGGFHTSSVPDFEFSCGTLTVDLPLEALGGRSEQELLTAETALANSLLGIEEITAVNILFDGQATHLYSLPVGVFTETVESVVLLYADIESQQSSVLNTDAAIQRTVLLYHPENDRFVMPTAVKLTASPDQWVNCILDALFAEAQLKASLNSEPVISLTPYGEKLLELDFKSTPEEIPVSVFCACVTLTLASFIPDIAQIRILIDGNAIDSLTLPDGSTLRLKDSNLQRSCFTGMIGSMGKLYLRNSSNRLSPVSIPMGMHESVSAVGLLSALFETRATSGFQSCVPMGIRAADILSIECSGKSAHVNLSANFYTRCQTLDEIGERLLAYSMINTLTSLPEIDTVCFTIEGEKIDHLVYAIRLSSNLMPDPGIVDE